MVIPVALQHIWRRGRAVAGANFMASPAKKKQDSLFFSIAST
jgi:hypothetical protein